MGRVRQFELAKKLGIDWRVAVSYLQRMQRDGIVSRMDPAGWREVVDARRASRRPQSEREVSSSPIKASPDPRFDALRRLIAKELHPDSWDAAEQGKELLAEMFKRIWPQVQEISRAFG